MEIVIPFGLCHVALWLCCLFVVAACGYEGGGIEITIRLPSAIDSKARFPVEGRFEGNPYPEIGSPFRSVPAAGLAMVGRRDRPDEAQAQADPGV